VNLIKMFAGGVMKYIKRYVEDGGNYSKNKDVGEQKAFLEG